MRKRLLLLLAVLTSLSLVAAACGDDDDTSSGSGGERREAECPDGPVEGQADGTKVGLLFDLTGRGDQSFNDSAACGLDRAAEEFDIDPSESVPTADADRPERLRLLAGSNELVIGVGFLWGDHVTAGAAAVPRRQVRADRRLGHRQQRDARDLRRAGGFVPRRCRGGAHQSRPRRSASSVASTTALIQKFEAGYVAGAKAANEEVERRGRVHHARR